MAKENGRIINEGCGGFLNPLGHPEHFFSVETDLSRRKENRGMMSLSHCFEAEYMRNDIRIECQDLLDYWNKNKFPLDSPEVIDWIHQVLGYFKNCYKGKGDNPWNVKNLIIDPTNSLLVDDHAGVHHIRKYYPEYQPSENDFKQAHWGKK